MPRKGENIYKRKDGRWEGRYPKGRNINGKTQYGYVYAKTYREVKEKLIYAIARPETNKKIQSKETITFREIAMEWFEQIHPRVKESTSNKYWTCLKLHILPEFGHMLLKEITHMHIEQFVMKLQFPNEKVKTGLAPKTVSDILSVIRSIEHYARKKNISTEWNADLIRIKCSDKEMRVLSRSEQEILYAYLQSHMDAVNIGILLSLQTGMRVGEVCALRWDDISIPDQTIYIHQTMQRLQDFSESETKTRIVITSPKSKCSVRRIPISLELCQQLQEHQTSQAGFFLTNSDFRYIEPRTMQNRFKQVLKRCNIEPANFHALRHTFATRCIECGFDVKSLSEILGHASIQITMNRYVHPSMELKKMHMEKLSELFAVK